MGNIDVDDYMSDNLLEQINDVKPGITTDRNHKRMLKIENERAELQMNSRTIYNQRELEKVRREEALSKPVPESSKGFALLSKMGFKPGMSLGKKKNENDLGCGIREPISLDLKTNRAGLGHEKEEDKRRMERLKGEMDRMRDMTKRHVELINDYRKRKKNVSNTKQFIGDILNSRKACLELDLRINLDVPKQPWFWKSYREQSEEKQNSRYSQSPLLSDHDDEDIRYFYPNGKLAEKEERFDELTDDVLEEKLEEITAYLRQQHMYCIWCGCQYSSKDELNTTCPGDTRQHHDDLQD